MVLYDAGWPRKKLAGQAVWFVVWLAVTVIGLCLTPNHDQHGTHRQLGLPPCPMVLFFHRPCPGCGLTTSWTAFLHGDLPLAFQAHPLGPILYLLFTGVVLFGAYGWVKKLRLRTDSRTFNWGLTSVFVVFLSFGLVRLANVRYDDPGPALADLLWSAREREQSRESTRVPEQNPPGELAHSRQVQ